jgi:manganese efflux pump family protein
MTGRRRVPKAYLSVFQYGSANTYICIESMWPDLTSGSMDLATIFLIAIGLAMDAFAVSIAKGITVKSNRRNTAILLASLFGGFQALMPVIGWLAGLGLKDVIMEVDHWIAFGLLGFIGIKMIYESTKGEGDEGSGVTVTLAITLAVATSIDALMVGLSFALLETSIMFPVLIIGLVTFVLSLVGFVFGSGLGQRFGKRVQIAGGIILILIGVRILIEHLTS